MTIKNVEMRFRDVEVGTSIIGYYVKTFKNPKALNPNADNLVILSKDKKQVTVLWGSGKLKYISEEINKKEVEPGTLVKLTKIPTPEWYKPKKTNQVTKDFFSLGINKNDTIDLSKVEGLRLTASKKSEIDADGFEY